MRPRTSALTALFRRHSVNNHQLPSQSLNAKSIQSIKPHRTKMLPHRLTSYNTSRPVTSCSAFEPSYYRPPPSPGRVSSNNQKATRLPPRPSLDLKAAPPSVGRTKTVSPQDPANYTATNHAASNASPPVGVS